MKMLNESSAINRAMKLTKFFANLSTYIFNESHDEQPNLIELKLKKETDSLNQKLNEKKRKQTKVLKAEAPFDLAK